MEPTVSKEQTQRLFVALPVPEHISSKLDDWTRANKQSLSFRKWVHPGDYHITLQFIGDTSLARQEELQAALKTVRATPISLAWSGIGTFGLPEAPRVLWGAVSGNLEGLSVIHEEIIKATRAIGFVPEDRPYSPHITLARGFTGGNGMKVEEKMSSPSSFKWEADHFVLMRTHMHKSPMYEIIGSFPLTEQ